MKVYKDKEHCVTASPFAWRGERHLMVCVGLFVRIDPEGGGCTLGTEQELWKTVPDIFAGLGQVPMLDAGLPKPAAEVLVAGSCRTQGSRPLPAQEVSFRIGPVARRIAVFGDRNRAGDGLGDPIPFSVMPLVWERAFGGPDFPANPIGKGLDKNLAPAREAPNLEEPLQPLLFRDDMPPPACPFPIGLANPLRRTLAGTFDQAWKDTRWPNYPDDMDPAFAHAAQPSQRLSPPPGASPFFSGDEDVEIVGMHHDHPRIRGHLPGIRPRAFVTTAAAFAPFRPLDGTQPPESPLPYAKDMDQEGVFREAPLRLDTVWLFPDIPGALLLHRGLCRVVDDEMDDVLRILVVSEGPAEQPKPLEHYLDVQRQRIRPSPSIDLASLRQAQRKTVKAVKMARDLPKRLEGIRRSMLGRSPVMPASLGDFAHSAMKTTAGSRAVLDSMERQLLAQREASSHLATFDMSIIAGMRERLDVQEKNLARTLRQLAARLHGIDKIAARAKLDAADAIASADAAGQPSEPIRAMLAKLDGISIDGIPASATPIDPWHDRGFALVIALRRALRRNEDMLARLAALGLERETLDAAWVGFGSTSLRESPADWGMPDGPPIVLPRGLCIPRFADERLVSLVIHPMTDDAAGDIAATCADAAFLFTAPGTSATPLHLAASQPNGAVLIVPDALSAIFAEQETGDFCHVVAIRHPDELADVRDLPAVADAPGGLPLVVILPPRITDDRSFEAWRKAIPTAIALPLPEGCPGILALAQNGHDLRTLVLASLPHDIAKLHDFAPPLPAQDGPPGHFSLHLPLPTKQEMQDAIARLASDVRSGFPSPQRAISEELAKLRTSLQESGAPPEMTAMLDDAITKAGSSGGDAPMPQTVADCMDSARGSLAAMRDAARADADMPDAFRAAHLASLDKGGATLDRLGSRLASLDKLRAEGMAKLGDLRKGNLPAQVKEALDRHGINPEALKRLTRTDVEARLAQGLTLERCNLEGLDLSGMDLSEANLCHAICVRTRFRNCSLQGADLTFCIAQGADFAGANLRKAHLRQAALKDAVLRDADMTGSRLELTSLDAADCTGTTFDDAEIELCTFAKATVSGAHFIGTRLRLCTFDAADARNADFRGAQAFKCLMRKTGLAGASFREADMRECLFQGTTGHGITFTGADMRKFHVDAEADLTGALFIEADLREATFRLGHLSYADFWGARLDGALLVSCDLSHAKLDGVSATGCRFMKCDLANADLSGSSLREGSLRKCRITGANLSGANMHTAELHDLVAGHTDFSGTRLSGTRLDGTQPALKETLDAHGGEA